MVRLWWSYLGIFVFFSVGQRAWVAGWGATDPESTNRPKILQVSNRYYRLFAFKNVEINYYFAFKNVGSTIVVVQTNRQWRLLSLTPETARLGTGLEASSSRCTKRW